MGKEKNDKGVLTMESDLKQFAKIMSVLGELYSKPLSEILIEIYWRVLKNYSLQEIKAVFIRILIMRTKGVSCQNRQILSDISINRKDKKR